jgi:hypothetical protein
MRINVIRLTLCAMLFALCFSTGAQQAGQIPRIEYLLGGFADATPWPISTTLADPRGEVGGAVIRGGTRRTKAVRLLERETLLFLRRPPTADPE